MVFKLIRAILTLIVFVAKAEAAKAEKQQAKYRAKAAKDAKALAEKALALHAEADLLRVKESSAYVASQLGSEELNERRRTAYTMQDRVGSLLK